MKTGSALVFCGFFLGAVVAWACPFCEYGTTDTAIFLAALLGFFVLGMTMFLYASTKLTQGKSHQELASQALHAENILARKEDRP